MNTHKYSFLSSSIHSYCQRVQTVPDFAVHLSSLFKGTPGRNFDTSGRGYPKQLSRLKLESLLRLNGGHILGGSMVATVVGSSANTTDKPLKLKEPE